MTSLTTHSLFDHPFLTVQCAQMRTDATKQYRTRLKAVTPPAAASVIAASSIPSAEPESTAHKRAVLISLQRDWESNLIALGSARPEIVVHADVGLDAQDAYLSMSVDVAAPALPLTLWVELSHLLNLSRHNLQTTGTGDVPIAIVAGQQFVVTQFSAHAETLRRSEAAMAAAKKAPYVGNQDYVEKSKRTAERYGERPWLFMRYELRCGVRRLAVNWAPFPEFLPACVL